MTLPIFQSPPSIAWDNTKTQIWDTKIQTYGLGGRKSLSRWSYPKWELECEYTCLDPDELEYMAGFFGYVRGQHQPFLWLDLEDYRQENVRVGVGDGETTDFQLVRNFADLFVEPIYGTVAETLHVFADDAEVAVLSEDEGIVKLATAPASGAVLTATFNYYWRVAFDDDEMEWTNFWYEFYKTKTVKLVTTR